MERKPRIVGARCTIECRATHKNQSPEIPDRFNPGSSSATSSSGCHFALPPTDPMKQSSRRVIRRRIVELSALAIVILFFVNDLVVDVL